MNIPKEICFILIILMLGSCSNELEIQTYSDPIPVCYCLLNLDTKDQYIRLSQTFQKDDNENSIFNDAHVYVEEWDDNSVVQKYTFSILSIDTSQNIGRSHTVFHASFDVKPNTLYKLYGLLPDSNVMLYGETQSISKPVIMDPLPIPGRFLTFDNSNPFVARFKPGNGASIFQNGFRFQYDQQSVSYYLDNISNFGSSDQVDAYFGGRNVLELIRQELPINNGNLLRVEYELISGGEDLALLGVSSGQTGNFFESLYDYSNLINGIGVFSSISTTRISNLELSPLTIDILNTGGTGLLEYNMGKVVFSFPNGKRQGVDESQVHRLNLSIAYSMDSLLKENYVRSANVSDFLSEYAFPLPTGEYVYKAGIICTALGDSCLWGGFPGGRYGSLWTSGVFTVGGDETTEITIQIN